MARAFTKESDNESVDDLLPEPIEVLAPGARNYITPSGASAMREHVRTLTAQRTALLDSLRGEADPSEKKKLRELDRRIRYFEERIGGLEIVAPAAGPPMRVIFGTWVRVCDQHGACRQVQICGVDEADPDNGRISWISPLAKALLGRETGDEVTIELPDGSSTFEIEAIAQDVEGLDQ